MVLIVQLQTLVVTGELPCTGEEAATLAAIQMHLDEAWPEEDDINTPISDNEEEGENTGSHTFILSLNNSNSISLTKP